MRGKRGKKKGGGNIRITEIKPGTMKLELWRSVLNKTRGWTSRGGATVPRGRPAAVAAASVIWLE